MIESLHGLLPLFVCSVYGIALLYASSLGVRARLAAWLAHGLGFIGLWFLSASWAGACIAIAIVLIAMLVWHRLEGWKWLVLIALMGWLVAYFSSPSGGPEGMRSWFSLFGWSPETTEMVVKGVRKTIHFGFYGLFGLVSYRALGGNKRAVYLAIAIAAAHAIADEGRQALEPNRTGTGWDVLLDVAGAVTFLAVARIRRAGSSR